MKNFITVLICGICGICGYAQQDAQYSMYMFNPIALNPAYAGSREAFSSTLVYRNQWAAGIVDNPPKTVSFSLQSPLKNKKIGLGMELLSDKLGPQKTTGILLSYAYRLQLKKGKLALGLRAGMCNYHFDPIEYKDKIDNAALQSSSSKMTSTGDFGLYYYSRTFYWGMAMTHLNRGYITDVKSMRQSIHFFMPIGKAFEVGNVIINPTLLIKGVGSSTGQLDFGLNVLLRERLWFGVSKRSKYGLVFMTQFLVSDKLKVGYSYDFSRNKIGITGKGSHEFMISYDINIHGTKMMMPRYL